MYSTTNRYLLTNNFFQFKFKVPGVYFELVEELKIKIGFVIVTCLF